MLELTHRDGVAVLNLAHGKANALDIEFCQGLIEALEELANSDSRALVLTASGSIFSAGVDLRRALAESDGYLGTFVPLLNALFKKLYLHPKPVVCAINGHAIAGGCILALAGDYRIMATGKARIGVPELRVGVPFPTSALEILRYNLSGPDLERLLYSGDTVTADDAVILNLVHEHEEPETLLDAALARAAQFAALRADAFTLTKRQVRAPHMRAAEAAHELEAEVVSMWSSSETTDHLRAYVAQTL